MKGKGAEVYFTDGLPRQIRFLFISSLVISRNLIDTLILRMWSFDTACVARASHSSDVFLFFFFKLLYCVSEIFPETVVHISLV